MASGADEAGVFGRASALEGEIIYCGKLEVVEGFEKSALGVGISRHIIIYYVQSCPARTAQYLMKSSL